MSFARAVRTLVGVHLRMAFNAGLRNAGFAVTALAFFGSLLLWALLVVPICLVTAAASWKVAESPLVLAAASGVVFLVVPLFGALVSLMTGEVHELDLEKLEPYPVPPWALFFAELVASFVHPIMAVAAGMQISFAIGALLRDFSWGMVCAALTGLVLQAGMRSLLASGAARLVRRAQGVMVFLLAMAPVVVVVFSSRMDPVLLDREVAQGALDLAHLPSGRQVAAAPPGESALAQVVRQVTPLVATGLLLALAGLMARRAQSGTPHTAKGAARLWTFRSPVLGLARLQLAALWGTELGRFTVFMPVFWLLFVPIVRESPLVQARPDLVTLFIWALLPSLLGGFTLNQFGLDRGAVKALFLLPITEVQVLRGKAIGLLTVLFVQCSALALAIAVLVPQPVPFLVAGPALSLSLGGLQLLIGQWMSVAWPRAVPRRGLRQPPGSMLASLLILFTMAGTVLPLGAAWWALGATSPGLLAVVMVLCCAAVVGLHALFTPFAAKVLALRREHLVESLS